MKISIVIPNYNKGQFIAETINSVLTQDYTDFEVILVDDCSTDNSWEVITQYQDKHDIIHAYQPFEQNRGGSACRNFGWRRASGDLIIFLDSDDILVTSCLSGRMNAVLNKSDNEFWVFPTGTFYKSPGDSNRTWIPKGSSFLSRFLAHELPWNIMSVIWRRSFLEQLDGFEEDYPRLQDVELHTRALIQAERNYKVYPDNPVDCYYRIDIDRKDNNANERLLKQFKGVSLYTEKMKANLKNPKQLKALRGTIFSFVNRCNYERATNLIASQDYTEMLERVRIYLESSILFRRRHIILLKIYNKLYHFGLYKVKGFNYGSKRLFMLI